MAAVYLPTKALKGSIEIFIEASMIHKTTAAIQSTDELGIKNKAMEARIAPVKRRAFFFPNKDAMCDHLNIQ